MLLFRCARGWIGARGHPRFFVLFMSRSTIQGVSWGYGWRPGFSPWPKRLIAKDAVVPCPICVRSAIHFPVPDVFFFISHASAGFSIKRNSSSKGAPQISRHSSQSEGGSLRRSLVFGEEGRPGQGRPASGEKRKTGAGDGVHRRECLCHRLGIRLSLDVVWAWSFTIAIRVATCE